MGMEHHAAVDEVGHNDGAQDVHTVHEDVR
jgi:hypothetical protein